MASGSAGSIYVDLLLRDSGFQQGLRRANSNSRQAFGAITHESRKAQSALQGVLNPISNISASLGILGATVASALSAQRIVQYSDTWRQLQGRLSIVETDLQAVGAAQEALFEIAQRNRSPLETVTNFYQRLNQFVPEAVRNQYDLLGVTESVTAAIAITGENSLSAQAALVQLSQGIGTNFEAAGQELRSIQEQAPRIATAIVNALGGGTKSLQQLQREGILTRDSFLRLFSSTTEEGQKLAAELAKIPLTVGQAFTRLDNAFLKFIGQSELVDAGTSSIAASISSLAENLDLVADAALALGAVIVTRLVKPSIVNFAQLSNAVITGNAVLIEGATAAKLRAQAEVESSRQSIAAIQSRISVLKEEATQYRLNLAAIQQQRVEAVRQAELARGIAASGLSANPQMALQAQNAALKSQITIKRDLAANTRALAIDEAALVTAQNRLTASTLAYDKAAVAATAAGRGLSLTHRAATGLINLLGGPWVAAFTVAAGAVWYLSSQQTASQEAMDKYGKDLEEMREKGELFSQQMQQAGKSVTDFTQSEGWRKFAELKENIDTLTKSASELREELESFSAGSFWQDLLDNFEALNWKKTNPELFSSLVEIQNRFKQTGDVKQYAAEIDNLANRFPEFADRAKRILDTADLWQVASKNAKEYTDTINEMGPFPANNFIPAPADKPRKTEEELQALYEKHQRLIQGLSKDQFDYNQRMSELNELLDTGTISYEEYSKAIATYKKEDNAKSVEELNKLYEKNRQYIQGLTKDQFTYNEQIAEFNELWQKGKISYEEYVTAVETYQEELRDKTRDTFLDMEAISKRAAENMQDAFADFLFDPFEDGLRGMLRNFIDVMRRLLAEQLSSSLFRQIAGSAFGAASSALFSGGFNNAGQAGLPWQSFGSINPQGGLYSGNFGGFFADGGYLKPGEWGITGEEGPEMIYGGRTGATVIPNNGGKSGNTYNIDARGADQGAVRRLEAALLSLAGPGVIENRVANAQRRGAL